ncbi:PCI-domain-containing protein [Neolentinus lepideus HHB14362 ss-1]|uniref:Eukaryotic translation initiation factor 3 subunit M n=1 Tax=Neolentinus lepideus HHB14362 ss-1 TaxID=1314782 RepID=A0A165S1X1_9AGAM|nr:PCI-domain-containing protein [Neolentinus lepideus HHB14362 ss-1]
MPTADIVSVFAEGTFEEQIQELVNYIGRGRSDEDRTALIQPFQGALRTAEGAKPIEEDVERRRKILSMVIGEVHGFGDGSDREIEGFFNLLYSHLLVVYPVDSTETKEHISYLLQVFSSSPTESPIKYRILSNLFNALPRRSALRLLVYRTLLDIASANDELEVLQISRGDVEKWMQEWDVPSEEKSQFLKSVSDALSKSGQPETAYSYILSYVRSLPSSSPEAQAAAIDAIAAALRLPIYDFDPLFKLDAVVASKDHELFSLLQVFLNGGLSEYKSWEASYSDAFEKYNLDKVQLDRKIRLLTLASLGFENIGKDLPYSEIAETLEVEPSQVEKWVIDVIRAGLLSGKLSQTTQTLHVTRSTARTFEREQWQLLEQRLTAWKTGLANILEVVNAAQKNTSEPVAVTNGIDTSVQAAA